MEQNREDLVGGSEIQKIKAMCEKRTCFFCTAVEVGQTFVTRPMSVQQVDDSGYLWFLSADDSIRMVR